MGYYTRIFSTAVLLALSVMAPARSACSQEPWHFICPEQRCMEIRDPSQMPQVRLPEMPAPDTVSQFEANLTPWNLPLDEAIPALMDAVETASSELQSEASLLFLPPYLAQHVGAWRAVGYRPQTVQGLGVRAWQEAALESMPRGASLWFKRLREDRVLRPL